MEYSRYSKRFSELPSPRTPPLDDESHKRKHEADDEDEDTIMADANLFNIFIKEAYPRRHGKDVCQVSTHDHITPETSEQAEIRLLSFQDPPRIDEHLLSRVNSLLLHDDDHGSTLDMPNLSQLVAGILETKRCIELVGNVLDAIYTNSATRQEMALRVLLSFPDTTKESHGAYIFWRVNHSSLIFRFLDLFESLNLDISALTYDVSVKVIPLLHSWMFNDEVDTLLQKMIVWLLKVLEDKADCMYMDIVETRMMDLSTLARFCTNYFVKRIDLVLTSMFRIVATAHDKTSTILMSNAIRIIQKLDIEAKQDTSTFYRKLADNSKIRIVENCVRLMCDIEDVPTWYDMKRKFDESIGVSANSVRGGFLLFRICLHSREDMLVTFGFDIVPHYLNSQDWQLRQAAVFAFCAIALACRPVRMTLHILITCCSLSNVCFNYG